MLEKHADFLRDFRGDTVHPVTMRLLDELGLFERFDSLPQSRVEKGQFDVDGRTGHPRRLPSPPPAPPLCGDGAAVGSARPDRRRRQGGAHLLAANAARSHRVAARWRHGHRRALRQAPTVPASCGPTSSSAATAARRLCAATPGCPIREYPVPFDVWWFRLPREQNGAVLADPPHQTRAGVDHDSARGLLPDRVPDSQGK